MTGLTDEQIKKTWELHNQQLANAKTKEDRIETLALLKIDAIEHVAQSNKEIAAAINNIASAFKAEKA